MLIRTADALALFDNSPAKLREVFPTEFRAGKLRRMTRQAIHDWGEFMPPLRARQLVDARPDAAAYIVGEDGLTAVERAALSQRQDQVERGSSGKEDSRG